MPGVLAEAWAEYRDGSIPEEASADLRRILRAAFYTGAAAYLRGLERAKKEAGDGDLEAFAVAIHRKAEGMQRELQAFVLQQRARMDERKKARKDDNQPDV